MRKLTTQEFIEKARKVHQNRYKYQKTVYTTSRQKIIITCPIHGDFEQIASSHLQGHGCPSCVGLKKSTSEEFINKAKQIHNNKYDYSKVDYVNNHTKICIICSKHGPFWQKPNCHLNGHGCEKCGDIKKGLSNRLTIEEFVKRSSKIHNNKYDYSKTIYTKSNERVIITCPIHGDFKQIANSHLQGSGCPKCNLGSLNSGIVSKGEILIERLLNQFNIDFISQYEISINTNINPSGKAYIDFYLPQLNIAIEYNGEQHYIPKEFFG